MSNRPQQAQKIPSDDVLAVARALAILHARIHHDAEIARRPAPARAAEQAS